jgi:hypothetical protein
MRTPFCQLSKAANKERSGETILPSMIEDPYKVLIDDDIYFQICKSIHELINLINILKVINNDES